MQIWRGLGEIPEHLPTVVTIGNFDGVHKGHQEVISRCVALATRLEATSVAITFDPHPLLVHRPDADFRLITPLEQRLDTLAETDLDATAVLAYVESLYTLTAEEFITQVLLEKFHIRGIVVGEDARFGANNSGNVNTLEAFGKKYGFAVEVVKDKVGQTGRRLSSSWARELLSLGNVSAAAEVLGHPHFIEGIVQHGFKRGRELGFPTANLDETSAGIIPADGVYAGWVRLAETSDERLPAAISVGTNPQFSGKTRTIEAHVLGRADLDLYGQAVVVEFIDRLRGMKKFDSLEGLLEQMDNDLLAAANILGVEPATRVEPTAVTAGL
ncbi:bifunctional riboflavin kinase/FAD synthetase [Gleimia sp. 6138-11-ORH1]|uniref:bifunctional riboflavin kinase/FAD synthetase n=1 Tax=Gleimia sp. 6138-11-ORH1 TaxID=2973937 RepID=UPI00216904B2|nr:bifunctional riboflavin kinase/FAD synthetase [Gleimia sp. 6138-11-ORH1]MCS4484221.1 bifunctional riboflavin kinase/FAD synthetase [Gleimia sp. 6138-11-ORH1]